MSLVQLQLDLLADGESPTQAVDIQQVLQNLPSELDTLYDTIWARIEPENLLMGSFMMQVMSAAHGLVSFLTMWLVDYLNFDGRTKLSTAPRDLEGDGVIDFMHRTAPE